MDALALDDVGARFGLVVGFKLIVDLELFEGDVEEVLALEVACP